MGKRSNPEHDLQASVFEWTRSDMPRLVFPELAEYHSLTSGQPRYGPQLNWFKAEGMEGGYPDTFLPVGCGGWMGLWIEFKSPGHAKDLRADQKVRAYQLLRRGYLVFVCDDYEDALTILTTYLLHGFPRHDRTWQDRAASAAELPRRRRSAK